MTIAEQEIIRQALDTLQTSKGLQAQPIPTEIIEQDGDMYVQLFNIQFYCIVKKTLTTANLIPLKEAAQVAKMPQLVITPYINPTLFNQAVENGLNVLDCAGNYHIQYSKGKTCIYLHEQGNKRQDTYTPMQIFKEAGLKVILYLLQDTTNINQPYRTIQQNTGVAIGTVKNVITELINRKFVLQTQKKRILKNHAKLLDLWVENYNLQKPKWLLGTMRFRSAEHRTQWAMLTLPEGMYWGGECAAYLIDHYLQPGTFNIYTDIPLMHLYKTGMVEQAQDGEISIYEKSWLIPTANQLAPYIVIYADLIGTGNSRCLEAAQRLLENELADFKQ